MNPKDIIFVASFLAGVTIHQLVKNRVRIRFAYEETEPNFAEEMMFDCPMCAMPAEICSIMTRMGEGNSYMNYYILNCLGEHETAAVTEQWYRENVLKG